MNPLIFCRWRLLKSQRSPTPFGLREVTANPYALAHEDVLTDYPYPK